MKRDWRARKPMTDRQKRILLVVRCAAMLVFLGMGIWLMVGAIHDRSLEQPVPGGLRTTGSVVSIKTSTSKGHEYYRPVVSFRDQSGREHTITGVSTATRAEVGDAATISYDPSNPGDAHDLSDSGNGWMWPFFTGLFILIISLAAVTFVAVVLVRTRRSGALATARAPAARPRSQRISTRIQMALAVPVAVVVYFSSSDGNQHPLSGVIAAVVFVAIITGLEALRRRKARPETDPTVHDVR